MTEHGVLCLPPPPPAQLRGAALFLDLDGTLVPFAAHPDAVQSDPARNALLARLAARLQGRLAIVSGRTISDIDRILDRGVAAVAGVHGLERRTACRDQIRIPAHPHLEAARMILADFAATDSGLLLEDKGHSVALHYRGAPTAQSAVRGLARRLAHETGLALQEGAMVVELRTPGPDKGDAIRAFMAEKPFSGAYPIFIGDDLTDEHGFVVVEDMGGTAILAGAPRATRASWRLDGVKAVIDWLQKGVK